MRYEPMEVEPGVLREPEVLRSTLELKPAWLSAVLDSDEIEGIDVERIGTGQMSESRRVRIAYADASDEIEYGANWFAWILRGVYPPPAYPPV